MHRLVLADVRLLHTRLSRVLPGSTGGDQTDGGGEEGGRKSELHHFRWEKSGKERDAETGARATFYTRREERPFRPARLPTNKQEEGGREGGRGALEGAERTEGEDRPAECAIAVRLLAVRPSCLWAPIDNRTGNKQLESLTFRPAFRPQRPKFDENSSNFCTNPLEIESNAERRERKGGGQRHEQKKATSGQKSLEGPQSGSSWVLEEGGRIKALLLFLIANGLERTLVVYSLDHSNTTKGRLGERSNEGFVRFFVVLVALRPSTLPIFVVQ